MDCPYIFLTAHKSQWEHCFPAAHTVELGVWTIRIPTGPPATASAYWAEQLNSWMNGVEQHSQEERKRTVVELHDVKDCL